MRYSLQARLRGFLLGALVGEHQAFTRRRKQETCWRYSRTLLRCCELIVKPGGHNWENLWKFLEPELHGCELESAIAASLPVSFLFHDNRQKWRSHLGYFTTRLQLDPIVQDWLYIFSYTLSAFLREESDSEGLISTLLDQVETGSEVREVVKLIRNWQSKNQSLASIIGELNQVGSTVHTKLAIALYCLLNSCEDFGLTLTRLNENFDCGGVATIIGALSGAYNSEIAIPIEWDLEIANISGDGLGNRTQVLRLADELLAFWSGVYIDTLLPSDLGTITTVASPRVMRLR